MDLRNWVYLRLEWFLVGFEGVFSRFCVGTCESWFLLVLALSDGPDLFDFNFILSVGVVIGDVGE